MMKKFVKYLKITYKWITGITIELIYPFITFLAAAIICFLSYLAVLIKK